MRRTTLPLRLATNILEVIHCSSVVDETAVHGVYVVGRC